MNGLVEVVLKACFDRPTQIEHIVDEAEQEHEADRCHSRIVITKLGIIKMEFVRDDNDLFLEKGLKHDDNSEVDDAHNDAQGFRSVRMRTGRKCKKNK